MEAAPYPGVWQGCSPASMHSHPVLLVRWAVCTALPTARLAPACSLARLFFWAQSRQRAPPSLPPSVLCSPQEVKSGAEAVVYTFCLRIRNLFPCSKPSRASRADAHRRARGPQHLAWIAKSGKLCHLLHRTLLQCMTVAGHLLDLSKACHERCFLLAELPMAIEVRVPPNLRRLSCNVLIL